MYVDWTVGKIDRFEVKRKISLQNAIFVVINIKMVFNPMRGKSHDVGSE